MLRVLPLFLLLIACGAKSSSQSQTEPAPVEDAATDNGHDATADGGEETPPPVPEPEVEKPTPASLYAECEQRVERPQAEGECEKDEDCKTAGCGNEVCSTVAGAAEVMTTCEDKLCFKVLDTCGCHEGQCTWTLKDEIPEMKAIKPGTQLPPTRLPPTGPPKDAPAEGAK